MFITYKELTGIQENLSIWKYMSLSKFIQIISTSSLWFNRLENFEDVFEGIYPDPNHKIMYRDTIEANENEIKEIEQITRRRIYVTCFHINNFESAAMWKLYAQDEGIAIKLDTNCLKQAFDNEEKNIYIEKVKYYDYKNDTIPDNNIVHIALSKRKSFEHEKELRCVFYDAKKEIPLEVGGVNMLVDLSCIIRDIYISPYAPIYLQEQVEKLLKMFNIKASVFRSPLYSLQ